MRKAMIYRLGAFGDILHASHLPRLIKEHYKIDQLDFETSIRGYQILQNNPYIDKLTILSPNQLNRDELFNKWMYLEDEYDMFFNLINSIEVKYCCNEDDQKYYRTDEYRRERCGKINFYDAMIQAADLPESYFGTRGELYYPENEHVKSKEWVDSTKKKYDSNWLILVCLSGSSMHKRFESAESICNKILKKYPKSFIVITGDKDCLEDVCEHPRILSKVDKWNFRTVMLMAKYFDFVISPETGLVCVSHLWDTPTLQLLTAASWDNHIKYAKNAYWVKTDAACAPCHKNPVKYYGCTRKDGIPLCAASFNEDKIMDKVEEAYVNRTKTT